MGDKGSCKAAGCDQTVRAKGYCPRHYRRWRKGAMGKPRHRSCNEAGCGQTPMRRGLCTAHFAKRHSKSAAATPAQGAAS